MRLLVIVNVYKPDLGGGVLFADLCEGLAERGFDVTVRCAYSYYPEWTDKSGLNDWRIRGSRQKGVWVERYGLFIPKRPTSLLQRMLYEGSFFLSLSRAIPAKGEFDAVMAFCPLVGGVAFGAAAARLIGCPLWLNVQDLAAEAAEAAGIVKAGVASRLMLRVQRWLFDRAQSWSTIAPAMKDRLQATQTREQPIHLIPNWPHVSLVEAAGKLPTPRVPRGAEGPLRLLYSGNLGGKQDLVRLCAALSKSDLDFVFRIQAGGSGAGAVSEWMDASGDDRFSLHALSDEDGLVRALAAADLFVVTEKSGSGGSFIPSKLLAALITGTPVLAVCDEDAPLASEVRESGAGSVHTWEEAERLPGWLQNHALTKDVWLAWHEAAKRRAAFFDRDRLIDLYAQQLRSMVQLRDD